MLTDDRFAEMRHLEHELVRVDDAALQIVDDDWLADELRAQRDDHKRHAAEIEELLRSLGEPTAKTSDEFRRHADGYLPTIGTALDTRHAARLVLGAELELAERYEIGMRSDVPADARLLIEAHLDVERRHVRQLERYVAAEDVPGQGHGGGAYNDSGGALGTGPGVGGAGRHPKRDRA